MKQIKKNILRLAAACVLAASGTAHAQAVYTSFNGEDESDGIVQEIRWPSWQGGMYDTWLTRTWDSSDGAYGYFYTGLPNPDAGSPEPVLDKGVNWSFWPLSGTDDPFATISAEHAGPSAKPSTSIKEGISFAMPAKFNFFRTQTWYRMVFRSWQPVDGTPHLGFASQWYRDSYSGIWYHHGTVRLPFSVTGIGRAAGFVEAYGGGKGKVHRVDRRRCYYRKGGAWKSGNEFWCNADTSAGLIENDTAAFVELNTTNGYVANTHLMINQPATPTFFLDPVVVTNITASYSGTQLLVKWESPNTSSPQFTFQVDVYDNAGHTGAPVASFYDIVPQARQHLLTFPSGVTPYPQLTIVDIFDQTNSTAIAATAATLSPATTLSGEVNGLAYSYYETATTWTNLPDFNALTPVRQGAANDVDLTVRENLGDYGMRFEGYVEVPSDGLYAFGLFSDDGSQLFVDGQMVVNWDGQHSASEVEGAIALQAGKHAIEVRYFAAGGSSENRITLSYEGPGVAKHEIPDSAFFRIPAGGEPVITLTAPSDGATLNGASVPFTASVTDNGNTIDAVHFYLNDHYWGQDTDAPYALDAFLWEHTNDTVRARVLYNGSNTLDTAAITITSTNMVLDPWEATQAFFHYLPSGARALNGTYSVLGDGLNLLTRQVSGDCTLIAHLADFPNLTPLPDGSVAEKDTEVGIILRGTTAITPGYPWGKTTVAPFAAVLSRVRDGSTRFRDQTMTASAGAYSSESLGEQRWYKLERVGDTFTSFLSDDGFTWIQVNSETLPGFDAVLYAGIFSYSPSSLKLSVPWGRFDNVNLRGNVIGPLEVAISPETQTVIAGLPAPFRANVIGPDAVTYQWQFNGANIPDATNYTYSVDNTAVADAGTYTVVANGVTSAPSTLIVNQAAGSGVWINPDGGAWPEAVNWSGGIVAGGRHAVADFSTISLLADCPVTLDGTRPIGTMLFDDQNATKHNWSLSTGSSGPLVLIVSNGVPEIAVQSATTTISAALDGTQGFTKTGTGDLDLTGISTYSGATTIDAGTLKVSDIGRLGSGNYSGDITNNATLNIASVVDQTLGGIISGSGDLIRSQTGKLTLSGANTYSGTTWIAGGTLEVIDGGRLGSGPIFLDSGPYSETAALLSYNVTAPVTEPGELTITGNRGTTMTLKSEGTAAVTYSGNTAYSSSGIRRFALRGASTADNTFSGGILASTGGGTLEVRKQDAGKWIFSGPNTYIGPTTVYDGTLLVNSTTGTDVVDVRSGGTIGGTGTIPTDLTIDAGGTLAPGDSASIGVFTLSSNLVLNGNLLFKLDNTNSPTSDRCDVSGTISGSGARTVTITNIGPALVAGNSFALFNKALPGGDTMTLDPSTPGVGLLWTNNLAVDGTIGIVAVTHTMTYTAGANGSLSGDAAQIVDYGTSGTAVEAIPAADHLFVNWSDGATNNPRTDVNVTNDIAVTANFANEFLTLTYTADANGWISGDATQTVAFGASGTEVTAVPNANRHFVDWSDGSTENPRTDLNASNHITVMANFAYDESIWISTATPADWGTATNWLNDSVASGFGFVANFNQVDLPGSATVNLDSPRTIGALIFGDTNTATAASWTLANGGSASNILTLAGPAPTITVNTLGSGKNVYITTEVAGTNGLAKAGDGPLQLSAVNTYSGPTTINAGTLSLTGSGQLGSGNYAGSITNNSALVINTSADQTLAGVISGSGSFTKNGTGTLTISGTNTYSGTTEIKKGTLSVEEGGQLGSGRVTLQAVTLSYNRTTPLTESAQLELDASSGNTLNLKSEGAGALTWSGDTYTTFTSVRNFALGGSSTAENTFAGNILASTRGGTLNVRKTDPGTWILSGTNTYIGTTTVDAGTLLINGSVASANAFTVLTGATLGGTVACGLSARMTATSGFRPCHQRRIG